MEMQALKIKETRTYWYQYPDPIGRHTCHAGYATMSCKSELKDHRGLNVWKEKYRL